MTVKDTKAPVVTILGETNMTLECGVDTYTELGATAYDACQGDMTSQLHTYGTGANPMPWHLQHPVRRVGRLRQHRPWPCAR